MPYLKPNDRRNVCYHHGAVPMVDINRINSGGDLQYAIAEMIHSYLSRKGLNYQHCQDMMGALAGAQMEFYRCVVGPYEQEKICENGRVYYHPTEYPKPGKY